MLVVVNCKPSSRDVFSAFLYTVAITMGVIAHGRIYRFTTTHSGERCCYQCEYNYNLDKHRNVLLLTERHDRFLYNYRWKWADQIVGRMLWSTVLLVLVLVLIDGRCEIRLVGVVGRQVGGGVGQSILLSQLVMVGEGRRHRRRCIVNHRAYGSRVDVATVVGCRRLFD
ncbi:hypothetical protein T07_2197 [Trichinella nelsoni]|uniref:Uncharacterized protein n=1 Tax=Trichinella nelsoni TaxID=6336 RepID=A0A0V0SK00_9BILA|nr:hypothetical protein T07_2197 [Trichinella nelsoni]